MKNQKREEKNKTVQRRKTGYGIQEVCYGRKYPSLALHTAKQWDIL
ncbi:MAG: hypothetical protein ACLRZY_10455 [Blautia hansenii]|jgi:hypothetical protein